ncbi:MAG: N-acetyltransferase, partial [Candidatus Omnitrophota bacterium]
AKNVGIFNGKEIEVMEEVIENYVKSPEKDYFLLEEKQGEAVAGFLIFGRTPLTKSSWDIYWLVVDKNYQGKGFGRKLLKRMEEFILQNGSGAVLRVETSTKKEFAHARNLYARQEFKEVGRIPDFYEEGDSLIIYYKEIGGNGKIDE